MQRGASSLSLLVLVGGLAAAGVGNACAEHHSYRVYDPYYTDYHVWNADEEGYYHRWANETHRDSNRDFHKISKDEQKDYWTWRHNHGDHDRDHDDRH